MPGDYDSNAAPAAQDGRQSETMSTARDGGPAMDIYMTAPEGDALSPQELIDLLGKAGIKVDGWGTVSQQPLHIEATLENHHTFLSARGGDGRLRFIALENPKDSILDRLWPALEKRGWTMDGD
jgi:hypothetical protein